MIKTVSFAPPRANSRSSAKASTAQPIAVAAVEAPRPTNESAASGRLPIPPKAKKASAKSSAKAPAQVSLDLFFDAPEEPNISAVSVETKKPIAKSQATSARATKNEEPVAAESTKNQAQSEGKVAVKAKAEVKAKKVRVPKDLAAQYGEKTVERPVITPLEPDAPKKRLSKAERQARHDLMKPSEGLMERLARANQISLRKPASEPRGKGWKFACGRCGAISYFQTPCGLCACGTIAVKE